MIFMEWVGLDGKEKIRKDCGWVIPIVYVAGPQQLLWFIHKSMTWRSKRQAGLIACWKG